MVKTPWRLCGCVLSFAVLIASAVKAEDFLYVMVGSDNGLTSDVHWVPAEAPLSARIIVEDLRGANRVYRYRDELWWWPQGSTKPKSGNLMGQDLVQVPYVRLDESSERVRQGDMLYSMNSPRTFSFELEGVNLETGEQRLLGTFVSRSSGLAIYEDRLYFGASGGVQSIRVDGTGRRSEWEAPVTEGAGGLFGGRGARNLTVYDGQLYWSLDEVLWQMNLESKEVTVMAPQLPHTILDLAVTDSAVYWISNRAVWRRLHGESMDAILYRFGSASLLDLCVVTAKRVPAMLRDQKHVVVDGEPNAHYQLLYSEDLKDWSPNFVGRSLFGRFGVLQWLNPGQAATEPLVWKVDPSSPEAYFSAWRYDLEPAYDADQDAIPDYWERRYFGDLSGARGGDPDEDGLTNAEEAGLLTDPLSADSDDDGLSDQVEVSGEVRSSPLVVDTDGDGLGDGEEVLEYGTNPEVADSDGDGFLDGFEVEFDADPGDIESRPDRDSVLQAEANDLMVHFDFENAAQEGIANLGGLGGAARLMGKESYVIRGEDVETASRALDLQLDPDDSKTFSYLETDYRAGDLGMSRGHPSYTMALWFRPEKMGRGTLLSARRSDSVEPRSTSQDQAILLVSQGTSLTYDLTGATWSTGGGGGDVGTLGVWTHIVLAVGRGGRKFYINGELRSESAAVPGSLEVDPVLWIGAQKGKTRAFLPFQGAIDDVRVYRKELTADVIRLLAQ